MKIKMLLLIVLLVGLTLAHLARHQRTSASREGASAAAQEAEHKLRIAVNLPAFNLTVYEDGRVLRTYSIAIGRERFPTPAGAREATAIIWNPDWIPPDRSWVGKMRGIRPGVLVKAGDARNPLGKIKITLGGGDLIHEAAGASDLGRLVSHGCIRMRRDDLYDLTNAIMTARGWPISPRSITRAQNSTRTLSVKLYPPIPVVITYETIVIENNVLHIYPDMYHLGMNSVQNLRDKLLQAGVAQTSYDDQVLKQILGRAKSGRGVSVDLTEIGADHAQEANGGK